MPAQTRLSPEAQLFIVQQLAAFRTPSEVAEAVEEEFGLKIDRAHVRKYNPRQVKVSAKWKAIFDASRKAFSESTAAIGISHQSYRLERLGEIFRRALKTKHYQLAVQVLETAANESGGAFTSRRDLRIEDADEVMAKVLGVPKEKLPT